jgi:SpoIID/LytB domain protein
MKIKIYTPPKYQELELEDYLIHVVPAEISPKWKMETLKAQAIACRTYALNCINNPRHKKGHICTESHCQVFNPQFKNWKTSKAITSTENLIVTYEGHPAITFYHASCGGQTKNCEDVFVEELPYLKSVNCLCIKTFQTAKLFGHGVGMCQWGAEAMARDGATYEEILKHYYQGCEIVSHE